MCSRFSDRHVTWAGFGPDSKVGQRCEGGSVALTAGCSLTELWCRQTSTCSLQVLVLWTVCKLPGDDWQLVKTLIYSATPVHISQEENETGRVWNH